ncbi:MAG: ATP synthase F1 subunit epsilon [Saprospiraceae bacterium]|nr:ATP synthase F1 subunit epsilon [Saprospiraceae bacterium]
MNIQILTPSGKIFEGEGTSVRVPGTGGQFEVLENHAAIVSSLDPGTIRIILSDGSTKNVEIQSGFIEVLKNEVALLVTLKEAA